MAETKQSVNKDNSEIVNTSRTSQEWFTKLDITCILLSMISFVVDLSTDVVLATEYWRNEHLVWSLSTFLLILVPAILIQLFSMRWHLMDESVSLWHWIAHLCLLGLLHRYLFLLKMIVEFRKVKSNMDVRKVYIQHGDICMLHLFESFLEAAPQFILQSYIMTVMDDWHILTVISSVASLCSLYWGVVGYMGVLRNARDLNLGELRKKNAVAIALQILWRSSMLAARLAALYIFTVVFRHWIFLLFSVHWFIMVIWIVYQKTDFCPSQPEEILYNCVVGFIYCFCFFNLRVGRARYRMAIFYLVMVSENLLCLLLFLFLAPGALRKDVAIISSAILLSGTVLGISCMLSYYYWLHPSGPLKWWSGNKQETSSNKLRPEAPSQNDSSATNVVINVSVKSPIPRSLKTAWTTSDMSFTKKTSNTAAIESPQLEADCTDKKHLLDHWTAHAGTTTFASIPVDNMDNTNVTGIEFYSVTNSPEKCHINTSDCVTSLHEIAREYTLKKRRGICSATELGVKFTKMERDSGNVDENKNVAKRTAQKRRGICSSGQLKDELGNQNTFTDNFNSICNASDDGETCNGKTSSESFNLDLDMSFSDINSSDINEFNENIVQKLCLSTLKNIKNLHQDADIRNIQKMALEILKDLYSKGDIKDEQDLESELSSTFGRDLETPSEALSAHDYENICAVNIAREAWGLRSWRACSDMGGSSPPPPPPPPLPQRIPLPPSPHQQYIRTVAYELAKCEETNCQLMKSTEYHKEPDPIFIAKPYIVDQNGPPYSITPLEPILEEIDDMLDNCGTMRRRQRHGSESALVATIDEIRNDTVTDSPRNVYHRAVWDSPCLNYDNDNQYKENTRKSSLFRKSLWLGEDPQQQDMKENKPHYQEISTGCEIKKKVKISDDTCVINNAIDSNIRTMQNKVECNVIHEKPHKNDSTTDKMNKQYTNKRTCNNPQVHFQKKIVNLHNYKNYIRENTAISPNSQFIAENIVEVHQPDVIGGSLQNLIDYKNITNTKIANETRTMNKQRNNSNRPRRKFSLLKEKFEPKSGHSDEEMLFQSLESVRSLSHDLDIASSQSCFKNNLGLANQEVKIKCDKENLTPKSKIPHDGIVLSLAPYNLEDDVNSAPVKDKSSALFKQVLSPPKINNWTKRNISEYVN